MLSEDIVWHVPGENAIAGTYRGRSEVLAYFQRRRQQAGRSLRFAERRVLVADDLVLHFAGGTAELDVQRREWETVGVYRVAGNAVVECGWCLLTKRCSTKRGSNRAVVLPRQGMSPC